MKIVDFYFEAARITRPPMDAFFEQISDGGLNYKLEWIWGEDRDNHTFTIYGNGEWQHDSPTDTTLGKLPPPHSRTWIRKLVKRGVGLDFARMDWAEYYSLRHT